MAKTLKDYLLEKGVKRDIAVDLDEITLAMHSRITRFNKAGVDKVLALIDTGKYRHIEQRSPKNLQEMTRAMLDFGLVVLAFNDKMRLLEQFGILRFNALTAEYEFTEFGKQFFVKPDEQTVARLR